MTICSKAHEAILKFIAKRFLKEGDLGFIISEIMNTNDISNIDFDIKTPGSDKFAGIVGRCTAYKFG